MGNILGRVTQHDDEISFHGRDICVLCRLCADMAADYLGLNAAAYEWADSYDSKDWDRLRKCIAPTLRV